MTSIGTTSADPVGSILPTRAICLSSSEPLRENSNQGEELVLSEDVRSASSDAESLAVVQPHTMGTYLCRANVSSYVWRCHSPSVSLDMACTTVPVEHPCHLHLHHHHIPDPFDRPTLVCPQVPPIRPPARPPVHHQREKVVDLLLQSRASF